MYVVFEAKGFQWVCDIGSKIKIPLLDKGVGEEVTFDKVLLVKNEDVLIGRPYIKGAIVKGVITKHSRYGKIIVYKYKRRKRYRRTIGHRQHYTEIEIKDIILKESAKEKKAVKAKKEGKVKEKFKEKKPKKVTKKKKVEEVKKVKKKAVSIELQEIPGIGPARIKKLQKAGIKDVSTFLSTDTDKLKEILGNVDVDAMKKESKSLLKNLKGSATLDKKSKKKKSKVGKGG
jgi:large subunit ribosomal protein L21